MEVQISTITFECIHYGPAITLLHIYGREMLLNVHRQRDYWNHTAVTTTHQPKGPKSD